MRKELLIGCGAARKKCVSLSEETRAWANIVTLDINPDHKPDVLWDLTKLPLPFEDNEFAEIHAYEVLEYIGARGDYKTYFAQFSEFWRILAPGGWLMGSSPMSNVRWTWGDPSRTRTIQKEQFVFLDQSEYTRHVGWTEMSDYRHIYKADFALHWFREENEQFLFLLRCVKPSRFQNGLS